LVGGQRVVDVAQIEQAEPPQLLRLERGVECPNQAPLNLWQPEFAQGQIADYVGTSQGSDTTERAYATSTSDRLNTSRLTYDEGWGMAHVSFGFTPR
jgi:hypothetical protein